MSMRSLIEARLTAALQPERLLVFDESAAHAGHAGYRPGGESHFRVRVVSAAFGGRSRVERHRLVNEALREAFAAGVHALAIEAAAPGEPTAW
ncbi:BolA family protein [Labrys wisconsinensis]|uniref:BolA protein n=1 Tax=Labrys wisconsinensis TaxID=425677 RepID=A0ABU0J117_9HYPH|nr:BolA family protein [Labrys wisconsinensis]MDQ0467946.1 BolA protein [Labrys wisconsinensis]